MNDELVQLAAQDLLESLQNFMGMYDTPVERMRRQDDDFYNEMIKTARAALAKAGKTRNLVDY